MKNLTILPLLAAGANKNKNKVDERGYNGWGKTSDISEYSGECSSQVPSRGGIFETTNFGTHGEITLDKHSTYLRCKHVIQADSSCPDIKVSYRSVAIMMDYGSDSCMYNGFRLGWTDDETDDFSATPLRCNCFGDGCNHSDFAYYFDYANNHYYYDSYQDQHLGPQELTINSNSFTLYFESGRYFPDGHVILDWECVFPPTTTTTTTSTTTTQVNFTHTPKSVLI